MTTHAVPLVFYNISLLACSEIIGVKSLSASRYSYTLGSYCIIEEVMSFTNISKLGMLSLNWFLMWTCYLFVQLVGRLSQEELMSQLPSFLPSLFDAFGNQSADVRKVNITVFLFFQLLRLVRKPLKK